ncbi:MAG TPA: dTDP-4-dehydrorhamnose 3,5-epimerase [Burkholderiales bacterium]|nr:dTDP-4-dehydrorhamnose 3,5-epimerase [Burkholderiales bacterium]
MQVHRTDIPDVLLLEPKVFGDERGFLLESYNRRVFQQAGIDAEFVQDNHSRSVKGVLRGLHYQIRQAQGKLVRATRGEIFDVAVDLRKSSSSLGRWVGFTLSAASRQMLWIPPGFAHGFLVLSDEAEVQYKATDYYAPEHERTLLWNDAAIGIHWPSAIEPVLNERDRRGTALSSAELYP